VTTPAEGPALLAEPEAIRRFLIAAARGIIASSSLTPFFVRADDHHDDRRRWRGIQLDETVETTPRWASIERSLDRLDGKTFTLVSLEGDDGSVLYIGGSSAGAVLTWSKGECHLFASNGESARKLLVVAGGQAGEFAERNVLPIEIAKAISKGYFDSTEVTELARWENPSASPPGSNAADRDREP
jgi:hypothetical protein